MKEIYFTKHAEEKFAILKKHKFSVSKIQVIDAVQFPDVIDYSKFPLYIYQKAIDKTHVLRVVLKKEKSNITIITFYPGRIQKYIYAKKR